MDEMWLRQTCLLVLLSTVRCHFCDRFDMKSALEDLPEPNIGELGIPKNQSRIAIIGAGMAGLAAADSLINKFAFKHVTVYEAAETAGGRIKATTSNGQTFHLGAQYLHNDNNDLFRWAEEAALLDGPENDEEGLFFIDGTEAPDNIELIIWRMVNEESELFKLAAKYPNATQSLGSLLTANINSLSSQHSKYKDAIISSVRSLSRTWVGAADWSQVSLKGYCGGDDNDLAIDDSMRLKEPQTQYFVKRLMQGLPADTVKLSQRLTKIEYGDAVNGASGAVRLHFADGATVEVDHVIVTVSVGVLKAEYETMFYPPLPDRKRRAIEDCGFDCIDKVYYVFDEPFWPSDIKYIMMTKSLQDAKEPETVTEVLSSTIYNVKGNTLLAWINGNEQAIYNVEAASEDQLKDALVEAFNNTTTFRITRPSSVIRTQWRYGNQGLFRGAYSYESVRSGQSDTNFGDIGTPLYSIARPTIPLVLFAGEATHDTQYSTIHGAYNSGRREAKRLNAIYSEQSVSSHSVEQTFKRRESEYLSNSRGRLHYFGLSSILIFAIIFF